MMWLNKMKLVAGVVMGVVLAGTGIGVVVRQTLAGSGQDNLPLARNEQPFQKEKAGPKPIAQDDSKAEIADLRKEIAGLRKEIKDLQDALGRTIAAPELAPRYQGKPLSFWMDQSKDADPKYRRGAVEALGAHARRNKQLIPVVVGILNHDEDDSVGSTAAQALLELGKEGVPLLVDVLKDKSSRGRLQAARTLGWIGAGTRAEAVPILSQTLQEEDWTLRRDSIGALAQMGAAAKPAIPTIIDVLGKSIQT